MAGARYPITTLRGVAGSPGIALGRAYHVDRSLIQVPKQPLAPGTVEHELDRLESEILTEINKLGIGPQGLGGRTTSLAVHVMLMPCHIASLPLAVNIQCHVQRHKEIVI